MKKFVMVLVLILLFGMVAATQVSAATQPKVSYYSVSATATNDQQGNVTWKEFLNRIYWFVIVAPSVLLMALPWIVWAIYVFKAHVEEEPQAESKSKKIFKIAIEIDIVIGAVVSGVMFLWFGWIVNGG